VSSGEGSSVVGGATIFLFNSKKQLKTGRQKLRLWPQKEADGRVPTTTPGKVHTFLYKDHQSLHLLFASITSQRAYIFFVLN
jgi:hypothetical protein